MSWVARARDAYRRAKSKIVPLKGTSSFSKAKESVREIASSATGGKVSPTAPTKFVSPTTGSTYTATIPSRGGGGSSGGGSSQAQKQAQAQAEAKRIAQENAARAAAEAKAIQERQAQAEKQRIENLKQELNRRSQILKEKLIGAYDVISGGSVTERRIANKQQELNRNVQEFNQRYSGKELEDASYKEALRQAEVLAKKQEQLNKESDKLATSLRSRVSDFLFAKPFQGRMTIAEQEKLKNSLVSNAQKDLTRMQNELKTTTSRYKKTILPRLITAQKKELARYKAGGKPIVFAGDLPIIPLKTIPKGITSVRFLGTQKKIDGGRTVVNIAYKTSAGRTGKVQGFVKSVGGGKSIGVSAGKSGVKYFKTPSKFVMRKPQSFIGVEAGLSKGGIAKLVSKLKVSKSDIALRKTLSRYIGGKIKGGFAPQTISKGGALNVARKAKTIKQLSAGRVGIIKGKYSPFWRYVGERVRKTLEIAPKRQNIQYENFISLSRVLTKGQLSSIAGRSITEAGAKAKFIGLIRNLDKAGGVVRFSGGQARQTSFAVQKLVNSMVGSIGAAEKVGRTLSAGNKVALASNLLKVVANNPKTFTPEVLKSPTRVEQKLIEKTTQLTKPTTQAVQRMKPQSSKIRTIQRTIIRQDNKVKQLTKQLSKTKSKTKQKNIQKQISRTLQRQRSALRQLPRLKTTQRQILARPSTTTLHGLKVPPIFKDGKFKPKTLSKKVPVFYVVMRKRGKLVKLSPKPFVLKDAKDYLAYRIDHGLSRNAFYVPVGKSKRAMQPPKNIQGYLRRNVRKFRPYRIKYGKRRQLVQGYIEKRRFGLDTPREKAQMRLLRSKGVRRVKRKVSPNQRKELLERLKKARAVRMRNLKKKK